MGWIYLVVAGLFEVGMAVCLKGSENFSRLWPTIGFGVTAVLSFGLLSKAAQSIPIGTAYAVWTGIGAFGTAVVGLILFREPASAARLFFLSTLIGSVIGLKLFSPEGQ